MHGAPERRGPPPRADERRRDRSRRPKNRAWAAGASRAVPASATARRRRARLTASSALGRAAFLQSAIASQPATTFSTVMGTTSALEAASYRPRTATFLAVPASMRRDGRSTPSQLESEQRTSSSARGGGDVGAGRRGPPWPPRTRLRRTRSHQRGGQAASTRHRATGCPLVIAGSTEASRRSRPGSPTPGPSSGRGGRRILDRAPPAAEAAVKGECRIAGEFVVSGLDDTACLEDVAQRAQRVVAA